MAEETVTEQELYEDAIRRGEPESRARFIAAVSSGRISGDIVETDQDE